jgi:hypothetical protein
MALVHDPLPLAASLETWPSRPYLRVPGSTSAIPHTTSAQAAWPTASLDQAPPEALERLGVLLGRDGERGVGAVWVEIDDSDLLASADPVHDLSRELVARAFVGEVPGTESVTEPSSDTSLRRVMVWSQASMPP